MFLKYLDHSRFHVPALVALCLLLFFPFLGARDFWDIETQFAEVIRVMALDGAYLLPTMNGELWRESPPLYFWFAVLFARILGQVNEWSIRLPSALSAMELILVCYFFARRRFGDRIAFFSSVVLATAVLTVHVERHVPINMTFYLFLTIALFLSMEVLVFNSVRLGHAYGAWSFAALACLTNGAAGIVFPALIIIPYLILSRRWQQALALRPFTGAALFFAVLAFWAAAVSWKSSDAWPRLIFTQLSIVHHSSHASADHQFFFRFPLAFAPWTFLIVPAIISLWPNRSNLKAPAILFLFLWFLSALAFSELLPGYHSHYVFLTFLPMALGLGVFLDRLVDAGDGAPVRLWTHRFVALASAFFLLMGIVAPFIVATYWPFVKMPVVALAFAVIFFPL